MTLVVDAKQKGDIPTGSVTLVMSNVVIDGVPIVTICGDGKPLQTPPLRELWVISKLLGLLASYEVITTSMLLVSSHKQQTPNIYFQLFI